MYNYSVWFVVITAGAHKLHISRRRMAAIKRFDRLEGIFVVVVRHRANVIRILTNALK